MEIMQINIIFILLGYVLCSSQLGNFLFFCQQLIFFYFCGKRFIMKNKNCKAAENKKFKNLLEIVLRVNWVKMVWFFISFKICGSLKVFVLKTNQFHK
jgi:hypothetical protein